MNKIAQNVKKGECANHWVIDFVDILAFLQLVILYIRDKINVRKKTMNDKKILVISLILILIALVLYVMSFNNNASISDNNGSPPNGNQNVIEPPSQESIPIPDSTPTLFVPAGDLSAKRWWLNKIVLDGKEISLDVSVAVALSLNIEAGKSYNGFAGCNSYSGVFTSDNSGAFDFGPIVSTKMYCMGASDLENGVLQAMNKIEVYGFDAKKNLILESKDKKTRLEYVPAA